MLIFAEFLFLLGFRSALIAKFLFGCFRIFCFEIFVREIFVWLLNLSC